MRKTTCDCGHFQQRHALVGLSQRGYTAGFANLGACAIAGCACLEFHMQLAFTSAETVIDGPCVSRGYGSNKPSWAKRMPNGGRK